MAAFNPVPLHFLVKVLLAGSSVPGRTLAVKFALSSLEPVALSFAVGLATFLLVFAGVFFTKLGQGNVLLYVLDLDLGVTVLLEAFSSAP